MSKPSFVDLEQFATIFYGRKSISICDPAVDRSQLNMNTLTLFSRIAALSIMCAFCSVTQGAEPATADKRDGQVLQALLLQLLTDSEFSMDRATKKGTMSVLHAQTLQETVDLRSDQMSNDIGSHTLPGDAELDLLRRNCQSEAKPNAYVGVAASFTNLAFGAGIVVADLSEVWNRDAFEKAFPKARGWVRAYLPGFSKDGSRAIVRAEVGPSPHGATVTALLKKVGNRWIVRWHHIAWYA
jgi:hypothetical protein